MNDERDRYESLRKEFDEKVKSLLSTMEMKEADSVKVVNDLENRYEHKLADQLDRYDRLSEEMELLRQKCEGLLLADRNDFTKQLNDTAHQARVREKKMRAENKRVTDDRSSDEAAFKEILNQQEAEYEDELRQLISAAEGELIMERENVSKLRTLVQTKKTKLDQLTKKLKELSLASKARATMLNEERNDKRKLLETIEHYKKNLAEREEVVAEKEKIIMELRSKTRTLENFRFVLDYRLQQLSAERGPITSHIEGLERHISTMYEELVDEFEQKKNSEIDREKNDQRSALVSQELAFEKVQSRKRERYINSFKRELGNIVSAMIIGKELEESVRLLYRKYVKGEVIGETTIKASEGAIEAANNLLADKDDDLSVFSSSQAGGGGGGGLNVPPGKGGKGFQLEVEETLIESAKEAEKHKISKEKEARALKNRLDTTRSEALVMGRKRLNENSNLLFEVNDLRKQLRKSDNKIYQRDERIKELEHKMKEMNKRGTIGAAGGDTSTIKRSARLPAATGAVPMSPNTPDVTPPFPMVPAPQSSLFNVVAAPEESGGTSSAPLVNGGRPESAGVVEEVNRPISQPKVMFASKSTPKNIGMDTRRGTNSQTSILKNTTISLKEGPDADISDDILDAAPEPDVVLPKQLTTNVSTTKEKKRLTAKLPGALDNKKSSVRERMIEKMQAEVEVLSEQLDDSFRIRENQRVEIAQLRKHFIRAQGKGFMDTTSKVGTVEQYASSAIPVSGGGYEDTINLSGELVGSLDSINGQYDNNDGMIVAGNFVNTQQMGLTNADMTGQPSKEDLASMKLGPSTFVEKPLQVNEEDGDIDEVPVVNLPSINVGSLEQNSQASLENSVNSEEAQ
jgi:hypothetical protein